MGAPGVAQGGSGARAKKRRLGGRDPEALRWSGVFDPSSHMERSGMGRADRGLAAAIAHPGFKLQRVWRALRRGGSFERLIEQGEGVLCLSVHAAGQAERRAERAGETRSRRAERFDQLWDLMKACGVDMGFADQSGHGMAEWALRGWIDQGGAKRSVASAWAWMESRGEALERRGSLIHRCVELKNMRAIDLLEALYPERFTPERMESELRQSVQVALALHRSVPEFEGGFGQPTGEQLDAHDALAHLWTYFLRRPERVPPSHELSEAMERFLFSPLVCAGARSLELCSMERESARAFKRALESELAPARSDEKKRAL